MDDSEYSVLPRKAGFEYLPIVTIDERTGDVLYEDGTIVPLPRFVETLPLQEPCLIVTCHSAWILALLQERWESTPGWVSKTTRREKQMHVPGVVKYGVTLGISNVVPHLCGWRKGRDSKHITFRRCYHFLDPDLFYASEKVVQDVFGYPRDFTARKLLKWAQAVRRFCEENDLPLKQTQGALGAKFLTDPRFYPDARRKVPKATNDRLRNRLPGNYSHVAVRAEGSSQFNGHYLDQRRAHHFHARTTRLPDANSLFAYGDFAGLRHLCLDPLSFLGGDFYGVVAGEFTPPRRGLTFLPPGWRRRSVSRRMVSTAEWPWLVDIGVTCTGLYAAWGSATADTGIPRYAAHAESELDKWSRRSFGADWLKPILVSAYGALAVNVEAPFDTLIGGPVPEGKAKTKWSAGNKFLHGYLLAHTDGNRIEPGTVNVLHRYLIEAATRTESLAFANHVARQGYWVLMIHVDAVIVEDDEERPPPKLFEPWRYKTKLTGLKFYDDWSFESLEMTRIPGRPHLRKMVAIKPPRPFTYEPGLLVGVPEL